MCLPVSRLFWVSSLAYPNLLGTKGYVVVVVVVVVVVFCATSLQQGGIRVHERYAYTDHKDPIR
jgi:hypothetical protein